MGRVLTDHDPPVRRAVSDRTGPRVLKVFPPDRGPAPMGLVLMDPARAIALAVRAVVANAEAGLVGSALVARVVVASAADVPLAIAQPPAVPHRTAAV